MRVYIVGGFKTTSKIAGFIQGRSRQGDLECIVKDFYDQKNNFDKI